MNHEKAIKLIRKYQRTITIPNIGQRKDSFANSSYSLWASNELIRIFQENEELSPVYLTEQFLRKMDSYSCMNSETSFMFSTAYNVAENIYDLLLND